MEMECVGRVCWAFGTCLLIKIFFIIYLITCSDIRLKDNGELNLGKFFTLKFCKLWIKVYDCIHLYIFMSYHRIVSCHWSIDIALGQVLTRF